MADQGMSSLSNVVVAVLVARSLPAAGFGAFGVAVIAFTLTLGVARALVNEPLLSRYSTSPPEVRRGLAPDMLGSALVVGVVGSACAAIAGVWTGGLAGSALTALAFVLPVMVVHDTWRYQFIVDRPGGALAVDVAWLVTVCVVMSLAPDGAGPSWWVIAWGASAAAGVVVGFAIQPSALRRPSPVRWFSDNRRMGSRFLGEYVTSTATSQAVLVFVGAVSGLGVLGAVRASQVFYGLVNTIHQGAYLALVPEAAQMMSRPGRMRRLMIVASGGLVAVSFVWMCIGLAMPDRWGTALFGATWGESMELIAPMGIAMMAGSLVTGGFAGVRSLGAAVDSLNARLRSVAPMVLLPTIGAAVAGGRGYAFGLAAAYLVSAVIWWAAFQRALARRVARAKLAELVALAG